MKYLIACLVIPAVQMVFLFAFTLFALSIGVVTLTKKLAPKRISGRTRLNKR